jgi:(5-formylfuran-3-yl)methyl phosphate synthase
MKLLVSVRSSAEALLAARGGADFIDLKEPGAGALGALPIATIRAVVSCLRAQNIALPISATIGDLPMHALAEIGSRVAAVAACGVDYVKVGITREPGAMCTLDALAASGHPVVPVFIADLGLDFRLIEHAAALHFSGLMVDSANKIAGSLFELTSIDGLRRFIDTARGAGAIAGLAGSLRIEHAAALSTLEPDFAGFRSAVCAGARSAALDPRRLHALVAALATARRDTGALSAA